MGTEEEIQELYLNGIASVKGGNRRLGQAFFKKVIRLNPRHEGAWLWLSELLDDPDDMAYCLEAVLAINPDNEKAQMALEIVQSQRQGPRRPREWSPLADLMELELPAILAQTPAPSLPPEPAPEKKPRPWLRPLLRAGLFSLAVLSVLGLAVYWSVRPSDENAGLAAQVPSPTATVALTTLPQQDEEQVRRYLQELDALLGPLRLAHDIYRGQHDRRPSMVEQVAYTTRLQAQVMTTLNELQGLQPPELLAQAHEEYIQGLTLEQEALDNLLRYYEASQAGYSNRAIVRLQAAGIHLERAKAVWRAYREWVGLPEPTRIPTPTLIITPTYGPSPTPTPTFPPRPTPTPTPFPTRPIG